MKDPVILISFFVIAGGIGLFALALFRRYPLLPALLVLVVFTSEIIALYELPSINLGIFNVSPKDIIAVLCLLQSLINLFSKKRRLTKLSMIFFVLGGLLAISLLRGISSYGIETAVRFFRPYLYFYSATLVMLSTYYSPALLRRFITLWVWAAWVFIVIAIIRWLAVIFGFYVNYDWIAAGGMMARVIKTQPALLVLQAIIFSWILPKQTGSLPMQKLIPYVMLPAIAILQHRTIWVVTAFILLCIFLFFQKVRPAFLIAIITIGLIGSVAMIILWDSQFFTSLAGSAQNLKNFDWRFSGWVALISPERFTNPIDYLIGQPFGTGYERNVLDSLHTIEYSPHNFYLQTFLNIGGLGLITLVLMYMSTLKALLSKRKDPQMLAFGLIIIAQLLFILANAINYEQGLILGIVILMLQSNKNHSINDKPCNSTNCP